MVTAQPQARAGGAAPRSQSRLDVPTGSSAGGITQTWSIPRAAYASIRRRNASRSSKRVAAGERGAPDLGGVAAHVGAVAVEHVDLVLHLLGLEAEEVAGVGVLRDQAQRLALAAAADQDPRAAGAGSAAGRRPSRPAGSAVPSKAPSSSLHIWRQICSASSSRSKRSEVEREGDAEAVVLALVPGGAECRASRGRR